MPRRPKHAGLDRVSTLGKSARWLASTAEVGPAVDAIGSAALAEGDDLDAGFVHDAAWLHALQRLDADAPACRPAVQVLVARRVIATFEEVTRLRPPGRRAARPLEVIERLRVWLSELRGHLSVFVVEDAVIAAHLARLARAPSRTSERALRAGWDSARLACERRFDRDFERRAHESRRVLEDESRRHLARVCAIERRVGADHEAGVNRVDDLVAAVHGRVRATRSALNPRSAEARFVEALDEALERWSAERRDRAAAPPHDAHNAHASSRAIATLVIELDTLRIALAEALLANALPAPLREPAEELLTRVRHVQIALGGPSYLTPSRAVAMAESVMTLVRETARERASLERALDRNTLCALDAWMRELPSWVEAVMGELEPRGTHTAPGHKTTPALAERVIALLGAGPEGLPLDAMVDVVEYGSASDRAGRVRQLRDARRAMLRRRRSAGLEARGRVGRPPGQ